MKKQYYIIPTITVYQVKAVLLAGSETMNMDSTRQVTDDNAVFSRRGEWGDEEE